jgi:hypothetical protein
MAAVGLAFANPWWHFLVGWIVCDWCKPFVLLVVIRPWRSRPADSSERFLGLQKQPDG